MHSTSDSIDLADSYDWFSQFYQFSRLLDWILTTTLTEQGYPRLGRSHVLVLRQLEERVTNSELTYELGLTKQAIGKLVQHLRQEDYLTKQPNQADKRSAHLVLTERGRDAVQIANSYLNIIEQRIHQQMGVRAFLNFRQELTKLMQEVS